MNVRELIDAGKLLKPTVYALQGDKLPASNMRPIIVNAYEKYCNGAAAICFCISVEHACQTAAMLCDWGIHSEEIHARLRIDQRRDRLARFQAGETKILCVVSAIPNALTDLSFIRATISLRPLTSREMWVMQCTACMQPLYAPGFDLDTLSGRVAAIEASDKKTGVILDLACNALEMGLPEDETINRQRNALAHAYSARRFAIYIGYHTSRGDEGYDLRTDSEEFLTELSALQVAASHDKKGEQKDNDDALIEDMKRAYIDIVKGNEA